MPEVQKQVTERADHKTRFSVTRQPEKTGRPRESRDRLTSKFLYEFAAHFDQHGAKAIKALYESDPEAYVRVAASLLPKEIEFKRPMSDIADDKLLAAIELIMALRNPENAKEIAAEVLND